MMSAEVDPEGKQAGVSQRRGSSPCPALLLALEGLLSLQLFHQSNGDLLLSRVRFGGGDGSRHAEIPGVVNGNSAPDGATVSWWTPHGLSSCRAMVSGACRRMSGLKLQVFVEVRHNPHAEFADNSQHPQSQVRLIHPEAYL